MSNMPPELAHEPMDMTHLGSIICWYSLSTMGAALIKTVPAITIRSASLGVPRSTSEPNLAISYLLVRLVAISTKQQERPKLKGQSEFFLPQARRSCRRAKMRLPLTASATGSASGIPVSPGLCNDHFIGLITCLLQKLTSFFMDLFLSPQSSAPIRQ